jgi:hypothetical protein
MTQMGHAETSPADHNDVRNRILGGD